MAARTLITRRGALSFLLLAAGLAWFFAPRIAPTPGFSTSSSYPSAIGAPERGEVRLWGWRTPTGGQPVCSVFDVTWSLRETRYGGAGWHAPLGGNQPMASFGHEGLRWTRTVDERWPSPLGDPIAHLWLARNALLHAPPSTWRDLLAIPSDLVDDANLAARLGEASYSHTAAPTERVVVRRRIDARPPFVTDPLFAPEHGARFRGVIAAVRWINVELRRAGARTDIVLRWLARDPDRELLTQRFAFVGVPLFPAAVEADWADPHSGAHVLHEAWAIGAIDPAGLGRAPRDLDEVRAKQLALLGAHPDPWLVDASDGGREEGEPVIGPRTSGFADLSRAFTPRTMPVRRRAGLVRDL